MKYLLFSAFFLCSIIGNTQGFSDGITLYPEQKTNPTFTKYLDSIISVGDSTLLDQYSEIMFSLEPREELRLAIKLLGKDFYKKSYDDLKKKMDSLIKIPFPKNKITFQFWNKKLPELSKKLNENQLGDLFVQTLNSRFDFVFHNNPQHIAFSDNELQAYNFISNYSTYKDSISNFRYINEWDHILYSLDTIQDISIRCNANFIFLNNLYTDSLYSQLLLQSNHFTEWLVENEELSNEVKSYWIRGSTKFLTSTSPTQLPEHIFKNYGRLYSLLEKNHPEDYLDIRLMEAQELIALGSAFPSENQFNVTAYNILVTDFQKRNNQDHFTKTQYTLLLSELLLNEWEYFKAHGNSYDSFKGRYKLLWSLIELSHLFKYQLPMTDLKTRNLYDKYLQILTRYYTYDANYQKALSTTFLALNQVYLFPNEHYNAELEGMLETIQLFLQIDRNTEELNKWHNAYPFERIALYNSFSDLPFLFKPIESYSIVERLQWGEYVYNSYHKKDPKKLRLDSIPLESIVDQETFGTKVLPRLKWLCTLLSHDYANLKKYEHAYFFSATANGIQEQEKISTFFKLEQTKDQASYQTSKLMVERENNLLQDHNDGLKKQNDYLSSSIELKNLMLIDKDEQIKSKSEYLEILGDSILATEIKLTNTKNLARKWADSSQVLLDTNIIITQQRDSIQVLAEALNLEKSKLNDTLNVVNDKNVTLNILLWILGLVIVCIMIIATLFFWQRNIARQQKNEKEALAVTLTQVSHLGRDLITKTKEIGYINEESLLVTDPNYIDEISSIFQTFHSKNIRENTLTSIENEINFTCKILDAEFYETFREDPYFKGFKSKDFIHYDDQIKNRSIPHYLIMNCIQNSFRYTHLNERFSGITISLIEEAKSFDRIQIKDEGDKQLSRPQKSSGTGIQYIIKRLTNNGFSPKVKSELSSNSFIISFNLPKS